MVIWRDFLERPNLKLYASSENPEFWRNWWSILLSPLIMQANMFLSAQEQIYYHMVKDTLALVICRLRFLRITIVLKGIIATVKFISMELQIVMWINGGVCQQTRRYLALGRVED